VSVQKKEKKKKEILLKKSDLTVCLSLSLVPLLFVSAQKKRKKKRNFVEKE